MLPGERQAVGLNEFLQLVRRAEPFEGASVFAGEIARRGPAPVRVRVELQALGVEDDRLLNTPPVPAAVVSPRSASPAG